MTSPGDRFGRLVVQKMMEREPRVKWLCVCDCGGSVVVRNNNLLSGNTTSCGCARLRHGQAVKGARTPEFNAWLNMKARVRDDENYRGRVSICDRWLTFENFFADMGPRPTPLHTVERNDNDGDYEPGNCRWATREEQQNNRRLCRYVEVDGLKLTVTQWSRRSGISVGGITKRLRNGWDPKLAVTVAAWGTP